MGLRVAAGLPEAAALQRELEGFSPRVPLAGDDPYAAGADWRRRAGDDLVLAVASGVWWGEQVWTGADALVLGNG